MKELYEELIEIGHSHQEALRMAKDELSRRQDAKRRQPPPQERRPAPFRFTSNRG